MARIQNNMMAANTHRQYSINNASAAKSAEKLSSGYKINRAGDDAAGLAISEKMRAQIRGLNMASKNSQDAISLVQTAEGALQEVHSMLQRMSELATQSATGTNEDFDRTQISAEFDQLKAEIDDISDQTTFNNMKLLDGSLGGGSGVTSAVTQLNGKALTAVQTGINTLVKGAGLGGSANFTVSETGSYSTDKVGTYTFDAGTYKNGVFNAVSDATATHVKVTFAGVDTYDDKGGVIKGETTETYLKIDDIVKGNEYGVAQKEFTLDLGAVGLGSHTVTSSATAANNSRANMAAALDGLAVTNTNSPIKTLTGTGAAVTSSTAAEDVASVFDFVGATAGKYSATNAGGVVTFTNLETGSSATADLKAINGANPASSFDLTKIGLGTLHVKGTATATDATFGAAVAASLANFEVTSGTAGSGGNLKIQVGANEGDQLSLGISAMNAEGLGLKASTIADQESAGSAITATKSAINKVSAQRSSLGAMQNRLEHKIKNLNNSAENLQSAESSIRDVDMASEMTEFTKQNILTQAATAMLAQANSAPQNVLQLLG